MPSSLPLMLLACYIGRLTCPSSMTAVGRFAAHLHMCTRMKNIQSGIVYKPPSLIRKLDLINRPAEARCKTPVANPFDELVSHQGLIGLPSIPMIVASPMVICHTYVTILLPTPLNLFDTHVAGVTWRLLCIP